jgi:hypothetical protein
MTPKNTFLSPVFRLFSVFRGPIFFLLSENPPLGALANTLP